MRSKQRGWLFAVALLASTSSMLMAGCSAPGALIEPLFVTDPFEASIAASVHGQHVIARALAEAIGQYLTGS